MENQQQQLQSDTTATSNAQPPTPEAVNNLSYQQQSNSAPSPPKKSRVLIFIFLAIVLLAICCATLIITSHHKKPVAQVNSNACINNSISVGSSGHCVSDAQTMLNFLETDNLNECKFDGSSTLPITGEFDVATETQVKVVQNWINCYNKQEGAPSNIVSNGIINGATWSNICTYAYIYPKQAGQSSSPFYKATLASGKDAGC